MAKCGWKCLSFLQKFRVCRLSALSHSSENSALGSKKVSSLRGDDVRSFALAQTSLQLERASRMCGLGYVEGAGGFPLRRKRKHGSGVVFFRQCPLDDPSSSHFRFHAILPYALQKCCCKSGLVCGNIETGRLRQVAGIRRTRRGGPVCVVPSPGDRRSHRLCCRRRLYISGRKRCARVSGCHAN